jgi:APA family basic amino acid/polyamine antiporter
VAESAPKKIFVREATGLVREVSLIDTIIYNALASGTIMLALTYSIAWIPAWFTGANILVALIITSLLYIPVYLTYGLIVASFPRTAGDYVYISRILYPSLGFASSFNIWFWNVFVLSISSYWVPTLALAPALTGTGILLGNSFMINLGNELSTPLWSFVIGEIVIVGAALIATLGIKKMMHFQNYFFIIGMIGYIMLLFVFARTSNDTFINIFNSYFKDYPVTKIISMAISRGATLPYKFNWYQTMLAFSVMQGVIGWIMWSQYIGGEIKQAYSVRRQWIMLFVPWAIEATAVGIGAYFVLRSIGYDFLTAIGIVWPLQAPPYVSFFAALLSGNWILGLIILLSVTAWIVAGLFGPLMTFLTRLPFAWAFDRAFPEKFSYISEHFHSPIYSIILVSIIGTVGLFLLSFFSSYFSIIFAGTVAGVLIFTTIPALLSATLFPFKRKDLYLASPASRYKIFGIPLISFTGVFAICVQSFLGYTYIAAPFWGFNTGGGIIMLTVFIIGIVIFYVMRSYRKRKNINLDIVFKEIPPE